MYKEILSAVAIALTLVAYLPYIRSVLQGTTKPHVFSWVIWGSATFIVFFAQLTDGAGIGAWPLGFSGLVTLYLAFLAYRGTSDTSITRLDWIFFTMAMSSLPLWYLTSDPLAAVVILTVADLLGFGPTIRKAYDYPFEEQVMFFVLMNIQEDLNRLPLSYDGTDVEIRDDLRDAHARLFDYVRRPGAWLSGAERIAVAEEARQALECALCASRKEALSPDHVFGQEQAVICGAAQGWGIQ